MSAARAAFTIVTDIYAIRTYIRLLCRRWDGGGYSRCICVLVCVVGGGGSYGVCVFVRVRISVIAVSSGVNSDEPTRL